MYIVHLAPLIQNYKMEPLKLTWLVKSLRVERELDLEAEILDPRLGLSLFDVWYKRLETLHQLGVVLKEDLSLVSNSLGVDSECAVRGMRGDERQAKNRKKNWTLPLVVKVSHDS